MRRFTFRFTCLFLVVAVALAVGAAGALAEPTSSTVITRNSSQTLPAITNPCTGQVGTVELSYTDVMHLTNFGGGIFFFTDVNTGLLTFTPDGATSPTASGHFATTLTHESTPPGAQFSLTSPFTVVAQSADGSKVVFHSLFHITRTPAGDITTVFSDLTVECVSPGA